MTAPRELQVRLAELIAALSLATDLGMGQPVEHMLRTCLIAFRVGESLGLGRDELTDVYYVALLRWTGCTSDSYELGRLFGDDLAAHARLFDLDFGRPLDIAFDLLRHAGEGRSLWNRVQTVAGVLVAGPGIPGSLFAARCEVAQGLAEQLSFSPAVLSSLGQTFERWDGRGFPGVVSGEQMTLPARIVHLAEDAEVLQRRAGSAGAAAVIRQRAGASYDPALVDLFCREADGIISKLDTISVWDAVLAAEPEPQLELSGERLDAGLRAVAQFSDLKSPYTAGHSTGVADLAASAAFQADLSGADVTAVRRAAYLHDVGRAGVPNSIWDKQGPLNEGDWERIRLHTYYTERVLARAGGLAHLAQLAALHHERLDGSGYHRAVPAASLPLTARILAAADAYHAMTEPRPYRPPLAHDTVVAELRGDVRAGLLDGAAVDAVLRATGHRVRRQRDWPVGLSLREVEVLRLLARGLSNREAVRRLVVSEPTIAAHVRHIYDKTDVKTRAGATLFAMKHGLLEGEDLSEL